MSKCSQYVRDANRVNPARGGLAKFYGPRGCSVDSYSVMNYWRRRFKNQNCYLSYFVPRQSYSGQFGTTRPYRTNGFSLGNVCPILYLGRGRTCTQAQLGRVGNNGVSCAAGRTTG
jgi:hypothetical protein